jgi:HK97 family phage prohead protease
MSVKRRLAALDARIAAAGLGLAQARLASAVAGLNSKGDAGVLGLLDFPIEGKAMPVADGLVVEGYAAGFNVDRQDEAFQPDASFEQSLRRYLSSNPILCYHHHYDQALGVVEDARVDSKGLFIRARLDTPEPGTELADVFRKVQSGTIKGFSIGGRFKRQQTPAGPRIYTAEIVEISITPLPVEPGSLFTVSGKAITTEPMAAQIEAFSEALDRLGEAVAKV